MLCCKYSGSTVYLKKQDRKFTYCTCTRNLIGPHIKIVELITVILRKIRNCPRNVKSSTGFVTEREVFKLSRGSRDSMLKFHCCCYSAEIELPINFNVIMILLLLTVCTEVSEDNKDQVIMNPATHFSCVTMKPFIMTGIIDNHMNTHYTLQYYMKQSYT